jgi:hypothetical protein
MRANNGRGKGGDRVPGAVEVWITGRDGPEVLSSVELPSRVILVPKQAHADLGCLAFLGKLVDLVEPVASLPTTALDLEAVQTDEDSVPSVIKA